MLPVGPRAKVEDYAVEIEDDTLDFEAAGGVA
jgi:hypothetical protein